MTREEFNAIINNNNNKNGKRKDFTREKLKRYIQILLLFNNNNNATVAASTTITTTSQLSPPLKTQQQQQQQIYYYVKRKYAIKKFRDRWVLIDRKNNNKNNDDDDTTFIPHYVHKEEIYDVINIAHRDSFHGGRIKTMMAVKQQAVNIKHSHVKTFIALCKTCQEIKRRRNAKNETRGKSIKTLEFGLRGQVDLINVRNLTNKNNKEEDFRYILNYQDNFSKFCLLRGLINKKPHSIIEALKDIFTTIGAPRILQTDNGKEFVNKDVKKYLETFWPYIKHIRGAPYHPQSQGSVERANGHVKNMLKRYLIENENVTIKSILPTLQFTKNTWINRTIKMSPFKAVFGKDPPNNNNFIIIDDDDDNNNNTTTKEEEEEDCNNNNN